MDKNKIFTLISKGIMVLLIVVGVLLSYFVISDGNPDGLKDKEIKALGSEIAQEKGAQNTMTQAELMSYIDKEGLKKRDELSMALHKDVKNVLNFTFITLILIMFLLLIVGSVFSLLANPKKFVITLLVGVGFVVVLFAIYYGVSDTVPTVLVENENAAVIENSIGEEQRQFVASNWRIASWAYFSTALLIISAIVILIVGEVAKLFR
jgi:hypothetical protein